MDLVVLVELGGAGGSYASRWRYPHDGPQQAAQKQSQRQEPVGRHQIGSTTISVITECQD